MKSYRPPDENERTIFFNYLKRATSLAAWERVLHRHEKVVETLSSMRRDAANITGDFVDRRLLADFLDCHRVLEKSVEKLRRGDKSCFRWPGASARFSAGLRKMRSISTHLDRVFQGEGKISLMEAPRWPELTLVLRECFAAMNFCAGVLESQFLDVPAYLWGPERDMTGRASNPLTVLAKELSHLPVPPNLAPDGPVDVIRSGETVPCSGIWEPCILPHSAKGFLSLFRRQRFNYRDIVTNPEGCMNYLHEGGDAPKIAFPDDSYRREGKPICWYLLWADDRYGKKPVPSEESSYVYPATDPLDFPDLPY